MKNKVRKAIKDKSKTINQKTEKISKGNYIILCPECDLVILGELEICPICNEDTIIKYL